MSRKREQSVLVKPTAPGDEVVSRALQDVRTQIAGRSFTDGTRLLEGVELKAGLNRFAHGLGRRPKGYLVVGQRAATATTQRIVAPSAAQESIPANLTPPNGATDYWTFSATARLAFPLPVQVGETITRLQLYFYRGGGLGDPTIRLLGGSTGASATIVTPVVAWTNPGADATWTLLEATYNDEVNSARSTLDVTTGNASRCRQAIVTVTRTDGMPALTDEHDKHTDTDKFMYLVAAGFTATVDLLIF